MKEKIRAILSELRPDVDFDSEQKLIDDAILDSFDIVTLVFELNDAFDLDIDVEELIPENFNSVDAMAELIVKKQNE
jgi:acyl carrier protein